MHLKNRVGRRMKLHDLHVLMVVVEAGSMGKAAARLNVTQPAVSRSISELEHALGVRLLDRRRQGVTPTEFGRALLDGGTAIFDELHQTISRIESLADPSSGSVRIGCSAFLTTTFVSSVVEQLSRLHPRIVFDIMAAETETLQRELRDRNLDFVIGRKFSATGDNLLKFETLYDDPFGVVAGENNPWARRRKIELADLMNEPWALPRPTTVMGSFFADAFRASGLGPPRTAVFASQAELRINLLKTGRFLSIFSTSIMRFRNRRHELRVLPVELRLPRVAVGIVTLKNRTLSPVAHLAIEQARKFAKH
jgi:DNA-binding transcriptional LysR family regulator